jgi:transposase
MSRASRAEWAKRVERWKDSGLSAKEFASETGLKATSLTFWSWKLRKDEATNDARAKPVRTAGRGRRREANTTSVPAPRFVEVSAEMSTQAASMIELVLNHGIHVRVPSGFDEATLTRLVRAVEAAR